MSAGAIAFWSKPNVNKTYMSEEKFEWTEELVNEAVRKLCNAFMYPNENGGWEGIYTELNKFKQSKQPKQKDWEVLTVKWMETGEHPIQSVKRLSDGEVFSVGDMGHVKFDDGKGFASEITRFYIECNIVWCVFSALGSYSLGSIKKVKQSKQPLFKTEDGKDIFEGDRFWCVHNDWDIWPDTAVNTYIYPYFNDRKFFSTEAAAKEYVIMNKPCLSANDIKWWLEKYFNYPNGINVRDLKQLVEQKIKR